MWEWNKLGWAFFSFVFFLMGLWIDLWLGHCCFLFYVFFPSPLFLNSHNPFFFLGWRKRPYFLLVVVFFSSFFFWDFIGDVGLSVVFFSGVIVVASFICAFNGDFFFRPRVIWVYPSSPLFGWSPVSVLGLVVCAIVVVVVVVVVGGGDVGLLVFLRTGPREMLQLFAEPALRLSSLHDHRHYLGVIL